MLTVADGGGGVKNGQKLADAICERSLGLFPITLYLYYFNFACNNSVVGKNYIVYWGAGLHFLTNKSASV